MLPTSQVMAIEKLALATVLAAVMTAWAQPLPPMPGAPEYPQGDPRSPQTNQGLQQGPDNGPDDDQADAPDRGDPPRIGVSEISTVRAAGDVHQRWRRLRAEPSDGPHSLPASGP